MKLYRLVRYPALLIAAFIAACGPGSAPLPLPTPGGGFYVETLFQEVSGLVGAIGNISFSGQ